MSSSTHALVTLLREGAPLEAAADTLVRTYPDESGMPHGSTCPQRGAPADVPFSVVLAHLREQHPSDRTILATDAQRSAARHGRGRCGTATLPRPLRDQVKAAAAVVNATAGAASSDAVAPRQAHQQLRVLGTHLLASRLWTGTDAARTLPEPLNAWVQEHLDAALASMLAGLPGGPHLPLADRISLLLHGLATHVDECATVLEDPQWGPLAPTRGAAIALAYETFQRGCAAPAVAPHPALVTHLRKRLYSTSAVRRDNHLVSTLLETVLTLDAARSRTLETTLDGGREIPTSPALERTQAAVVLASRSSAAARHDAVGQVLGMFAVAAHEERTRGESAFQVVRHRVQPRRLHYRESADLLVLSAPESFWSAATRLVASEFPDPASAAFGVPPVVLLPTGAPSESSDLLDTYAQVWQPPLRARGYVRSEPDPLSCPSTALSVAQSLLTPRPDGRGR